jgi:hypothetical protein
MVCLKLSVFCHSLVVTYVMDGGGDRGSGTGYLRIGNGELGTETGDFELKKELGMANWDLVGASRPGSCQLLSTGLSYPDASPSPWACIVV